MNFIAIDVETANSDYSSICQIGIANYRDGEIHETWSSLVNPEAYFDSFNTSIHGIKEKDVKEAPTFDKIYKEIKERIEGNITIHHMPFDKTAINRACSEYELDLIQARWLDSAKIVRRTWTEFSSSGYGLANMAKFLEISFKHHDALEDAIAAAEIVRHACEKTGILIEDWFKRVGQPVYLYKGGSSTVKYDGNVEGPLYGETVVFTGELSLPRKEIGAIASDLGCNVGSSVTKKTTLLVVGIQSQVKLAGYDKSSKHRKAEELVKTGIALKILSEKDFVEMCKHENVEVPIDAPIESIQEIKPIKESKPKKKGLSLEVPIDPLLQKLWIDARATFKQIDHDGKRVIGKQINLVLSEMNEFSLGYLPESDDENLVELKSIIDFEVEELKDVVNEFMRNKNDLLGCDDRLGWFVAEVELWHEDLTPELKSDTQLMNFHEEILRRISAMEQILSKYQIIKPR